MAPDSWSVAPSRSPTLLDCTLQVNRIWDESKDMRYFRRVDVARWVMTFLIGVFTALTAVLITYVSDYLSQVKFKAVSKVIGARCCVLFRIDTCVTP